MKLNDCKKGAKVEAGKGIDYLRGEVVGVDGIFVIVEVVECGKRKTVRVFHDDLHAV